MYKPVVKTLVAMGAFVGKVHAEAVCLDAKATHETNERLRRDHGLVTRKLTAYPKADGDD